MCFEGWKPGIDAVPGTRIADPDRVAFCPCRSLALRTIVPRNSDIKAIWCKWDKWAYMPLAKVDDRGRVQLPNKLRSRMKLKEVDEFVAEDLGEDTIILKTVNLRALLEDAIEKAKSIDLDKLEREIEEDSNQLACQKFKVSPR